MEINVRVSTKSPASVENVGGDGGRESFGVERRDRTNVVARVNAKY